VHDAAHFSGGDEDAVFQAFDAEEAVAGAVRGDGTFDHASGVGAYGVL
jgi:hypothetical protein